MPDWVWWIPLGMILLAGGLYAFRMGWIAANMTETAAIEAYAARYLENAGGAARPSDCFARPGDDVWLVIRCGTGGQAVAYHVNRFGGLVREVRGLNGAMRREEPST